MKVRDKIKDAIKRRNATDVARFSHEMEQRAADLPKCLSEWAKNISRGVDISGSYYGKSPTFTLRIPTPDALRSFPEICEIKGCKTFFRAIATLGLFFQVEFLSAVSGDIRIRISTEEFVDDYRSIGIWKGRTDGTLQW